MTTTKERFVVRPATDRPGFVIVDTKDGSLQAARPTMTEAKAYADDKNRRAS
jgi:hypothetical protein